MNEKNRYRIVMLLENCGYPADCRVKLEATTLCEAGHRVSVICPSDKALRATKYYEDLDGVQVYRYPTLLEFDGVLGFVWEFSYSFFMAWAISSYIALRHGLDVVHIHMPPDLNGLLGVYFKLLGKKYVMDHHDLSPEMFAAQGRTNSLLLRLLYFFERISCQWADRLIATNSTQRNIQIQRGGARPQHCAIVRNGPSDFFFNVDHEPFDYRTTPGTKIIGYVGEMNEQDGVDSLIRSAHCLKSSLGRDDFLLVIVGPGRAVPGLKRMVTELNLDDHVRFTGVIPFDDVPNYIAGFDICTTPDPSNPYNDSCTTIKTMEYMAMCKPTVAYDTAENRFTARSAALYVKDNDELEFAKALSCLMNDTELRSTLGETGRKRIEQSLSWTKQQQGLIEVYNSLQHNTELAEFTFSEPASSKAAHDSTPNVDLQALK